MLYTYPRRDVRKAISRAWISRCSCIYYQQYTYTINMKKTIVAILALSGIALGATGSTTFNNSGNTYEAGSVYGSLMLNENMTTGTDTDLGITFDPNVNIKSDWTWFSAGDYTVSMWVEADSLAQNQILFGYCGKWKSNAQGYNGLTWNAADKTLTLGHGEWKAADKTFTYLSGVDDSSKTETLTFGDAALINITLAVSSATNGKMTADVWINGEMVQSLATYNGDMHNSPDDGQMLYFVGTNGATFGTISLTNGKLTDADAIAELAGATRTPEPATATLSLLALAALASRRRRH